MKERPILFSGPMVRAILELFKSGKTHVEIARELGFKSKFHVARICRANGLRRAAARRPGVGAGDSNPAWKGGRRIRSDGYVVVWTPSGERLEHRLIMEQHLGRALHDSEVVHHLDENKQNNAIENLRLMSQSEHAKIHAPAMHAARYGT